jgi:hypothetical protein
MLTVDLVTADVTVYVVANEVQTVPLIVGKSFLNRAGVTMVLRDNQLRLFEKHLAVLPDIDALPQRRLALWTKDAVIILPRTIGFIEVNSSEGFGGEVYVEGALRQQPGHEYSIPGCITTAGGVIPVSNLADSDLEVSACQLLAQGVPCSPENPTTEVIFPFRQAN